MNAFESDKRRRNLAEGFEETKGLKNGHCNRRACQRPLTNSTGEHFYMKDHETFTADGRLYYCEPCAAMFIRDDRHYKSPQRITRERDTE